MKLIELRGRYAKGEHAHTLVDDELFRELNQYKWKAKPNGCHNQIYAIRTTKINGRTRDVRMHREVLGVDWDGVLDIDHINRNSLDNRRRNLRLCTRSVNVRNSDKTGWSETARLASIAASKKRKGTGKYLCHPYLCAVKFGRCVECGVAFRVYGEQKYCSDSCRYQNKNRLRLVVHENSMCDWCGRRIVKAVLHQRFCSVNCRKADYNHGRRKPPKVL